MRLILLLCDPTEVTMKNEDLSTHFSILIGITNLTPQRRVPVTDNFPGGATRNCGLLDRDRCKFFSKY